MVEDNTTKELGAATSGSGVGINSQGGTVVTSTSTSEEYNVIVSSADGTKSYNVDAGTWASVKDGDRVAIEKRVGVLGRYGTRLIPELAAHLRMKQEGK